MSDTKPHHAPTPDPVESDGVAYKGIGWFLVVLVLTVVASQIVVWGAFEFFEWRVARSEAPRAAMAGPVTSPTFDNGRLVDGTDESPSPSLLVHEPTVLRDFNHRQDDLQATYGWIDQAMGTVRLPIARAKQLVLERGLPTRPAPEAAPAPAASAAPTVSAPAPAAPAAH